VLDHPPTFPALPAAFGATRASLHLVAARVLGAARYASVGRLGLVVVPGGFATPAFDGRQLLVIDGQLSDGTHRQPITTLTDACAFAGVDPTAPTHRVLDLPADPSAPLTVESTAARLLADWFAFSQSLLESLPVDPDPAGEPSAIQLWPEHFDLAREIGPPGARANYGASPGDASTDTPYLYVGPHELRDGPFWNAPFGAALTYDEIGQGSDPRVFFSTGGDLLRLSTSEGSEPDPTGS